jgi:hypothetical protein
MALFDQLVVSCASLGLAFGVACRTVQRDECGRPLPPPAPAVAYPRSIANVEPRSFLGVAIDSTTKNRLPGVSFYFPDLKTDANTDSLGFVRFRELPPGWHPLMVRRIGYEPRRDTVQVSAFSGTVVVYELPKRRYQLCETVITR